MRGRDRQQGKRQALAAFRRAEEVEMGTGADGNV